MAKYNEERRLEQEKKDKKKAKEKARKERMKAEGTLLTKKEKVAKERFVFKKKISKIISKSEPNNSKWHTASRHQQGMTPRRQKPEPKCWQRIRRKNFKRRSGNEPKWRKSKKRRRRSWQRRRQSWRLKRPKRNCGVLFYFTVNSDSIVLGFVD